MLEALWSAIVEQPEDAGPWQILGDALELAGDPRGHLIALQLALETSDSPQLEAEQRRWLFEHGDALLGPLFRTAEPWRAEWRRGFLHTLELVVDGYTEQTARTLATLADGCGLLPLQHLRLVSSANFDAAVTELLQQDWPLLESLRLGPLVMGAGRLDVPLQRVLDGMPALKTLRIQYPQSLAGLRHARLESLHVAAEPNQLGAFQLDGLPALSRLEVFTRDPVQPEALAGFHTRRLEEVSLHPHVASAWLAARVPLPERLVLWERGHIEMLAGNRSCEVAAGVYADESADPLLTSPRQEQIRKLHKGPRFWQVHREGSTLHFRYGKVGKNGTARQAAHRTAYEASRDYRKRLGDKLDNGYEDVFV